MISRHRTIAPAIATAIVMALAPLHAMAQTPAAPDPEALALARQYISMTDVDRQSTLASMRGPMAAMLTQGGVPADRSAVLVQEALMPVLNDHFDDLLTVMAQTYAKVLTVDDLKAAIAFNQTPAGQHILHAQPVLAREKIVSLTHWMGTLQPEMTAKIAAAEKAHGWDKQ